MPPWWGMSQELGRAEKTKILEVYPDQQVFLEDMQERTNQMWKRIEARLLEYQPHPSGGGRCCCGGFGGGETPPGGVVGEESARLFVGVFWGRMVLV